MYGGIILEVMKMIVKQTILINLSFYKNENLNFNEHNRKINVNLYNKKLLCFLISCQKYKNGI